MNIDNLIVGEKVKVQLKPHFEISGLVECRVFNHSGTVALQPYVKNGFNFFTGEDIESFSIVQDDKDTGEGPKHDKGKPDWTLLPMFAVEEVVQVLDFGASKYYRGSWRKVPECKRRYIAACYRHLMDYYWRHIRLDDESGLHHLAHAACCVLFVLEMDLLEPAKVSSDG
jgi:hypothetical protein